MDKDAIATELTEKYLQTLDIPEGAEENPYKIFFIGVVGCGKSYVAKKLSDKLGVYLEINDGLRRFMNSQGYEGVSPDPELMRKIGLKRTRHLFSKRINHILDADSVNFVQLAKDYTKKCNYKAVFIKIECPEDLIIKRLREREKNPDNESRGTIRDYYWRKEMHKRLTVPEDIFYTIDNSKDVEPQIDEIISKMKQEGIIV